MREFISYRPQKYEPRGVRCGFCGSNDMNTNTMTCRDCNTTAANTRFRDRRKKVKEENAVSS